MVVGSFLIEFWVVTLVSQGSIFELGFFTPGTSNNIYLGIWYKNIASQTIVWVANREQKLSELNSLRLEISEDNGNFVSPTPKNIVAVLQDNGNFVVRDVTNPSTIYWQSFGHLTDTWLPGAKLGINKPTGRTQVLTSWKNFEDPTPGRFSLGIDPVERNQYFIEWNNLKRYWSSGVWNGDIFNYSFISNENESYLTYISSNSSIARFVLGEDGRFRQLTWLAGSSDWNLRWAEPGLLSQVYAFCGSFGIFRGNLSIPFCECLPNFEPVSIEDTKLNDWSGGGVRNASLQCQNSTDKILKNSEHNNNTRKFKTYAYVSNGCLLWEGELLNLQQLSYESNTKQDLYLKQAAPDQLPKAGGDRKNMRVIITVPVSLAAVAEGTLLSGDEDSSEDLLLFDFSASADAAAETNTGNNLGRSGKDVELPLSSFASVSAATGYFSAANKLGEGGFGPVYKGNLLKGQELAVKRLSGRSGQGLQEFKNETVLIAKLQHRNLVKLLGCCIERDENILIYEYMPNKSLDFFLFDPNKQGLLDWRTRTRIIEGIVQGLLYLHEYSRLRIIHRDLKANNILLDCEMNPKISDFGMARIFGGNKSQANTNRIVGTYGYMSPEYAMECIFSIKSNVFSFGVLLLEIVSGKKNTGFYHSDSLYLLGYAWELWSADRVVELMDPKLGNPPPATTLLRYINIGLLCVQGNANDRPTMSDVVSMLTNEYAPLPIPKEPAFFTGRGVMNTNPSLGNARNCSVNTATVSVIDGR
ncbi:putative G-type lectin S-receptor-like serine/threonine-protein kinase At1g61610 [Cornus florida]|uniref:putative G-type lectin S-receptor-like serine/threonine-protein kinase At1g61610 n=1 Tax=Cornus florida TaxID=4283 RepID=UPI00289FD553|nr:putative G-type lectin S-receptor-like serine/threonine-protein kinase At1g61610 [Cornus florida]